ncbi:MAG: hypothetical protein H6581_11910 [Bacteroidia bacterium]|nr:hypothetical protein [Bacteroidia bacterium]
MNEDLVNYRVPRFGDVGVFRVLEIGKHNAIQGETGNNSYIFPGDTIMAAFGTRYATNQFEGYCPDKIEDEYQILGKGGAIGVLKSMHYKLLNAGSTNLKLLSYATDIGGNVINTVFRDKERIPFNPNRPRPYKVVLSIGSSMDSGKTTSAAYMARGLSLSGQKVAYVKLTGTVYSRDRSFVRDCGAEISIDFSALGYPATYMVPIPEILDIYDTLLNRVAVCNPDYVIVEIADGLLQQETLALLKHHAFMSTVHSILFSAGDSMGAISGLQFLNDLGHYPFALTGLFTAAPLLAKEVSENVTSPILFLNDLSSEGIVNWIEGSRQKIIA